MNYRFLTFIGSIVFLASSVLSARAADYVVITREVSVNRSPDQVWKRIGNYCSIADWLKVTCEYASGSGEVGTVRRINGTTIEPMVAKTPYSYTYWQTVGNMAPTSYHGTVAVEPAGAGKSRLTYTLFYDQAALGSDSLRSSEHERLATRFQAALYSMKTIAEAR
ncbi:MAG: SRPBCC family protein [Edaphobacter sp.]